MSVDDQLNEIMFELAHRLSKGMRADSESVQKQIDLYYQNLLKLDESIDINKFSQMGALYASDVRFRDQLNSVAHGFADYISDAIACYCAKIMFDQ